MARTQTRFTISVTEQDIERAHRTDSYRCVVAQAIARSIPDAHNIDVDTQTVRFTRQGERLWYLTPYAVQGYVIAFDAGDPIEPFDFTIQNPRKARRTAVLTEEQREEKREADRARRRAKAREQRESGKAKSTAAAAQTRVTTGTGKTPPRVFRTKRRYYGHRVLRVNQQ